MRVVTTEGLAVETVTAMKRLYLKRPTRAERLTLRDAAIAHLRRHGWRRQDLQAVFGLKKRQLNQILADLAALRAASLAYEEDAA